MNTIRNGLLVLLLCSAVGAAPSQEPPAGTSKDPLEAHFDEVKVGELSFTNVWVFRQTNFNILIRHNGGIHTIKLTDLPGNELAELQGQIGMLATLDHADPNADAKTLLGKFKALVAAAGTTTVTIVGGSAVLFLLLVIAMLARRKKSGPTA
jgi:hypothetical protein